MKLKAVNRAKLIGGISSAFVFILIISVTLFGDDTSIGGDYSDIITIAACVFLSIWCVYVDYRIQSAKVHTYAFAIYFVSFVWIVLDYFRRLVDFSAAAIRIFTYLYAAPVLLLAVLCFFLFLEIFFGNSKYKSVIRACVVGVGLVLFCLVMTNDVHHFILFIRRVWTMPKNSRSDFCFTSSIFIPICWSLRRLYYSGWVLQNATIIRKSFRP